MPPRKRRTQRESGGFSDEARERAWRAVRAFNKLTNGLNTYARAVTGNPNVRVKSTHTVSNTDGKTIWIRPPITLGDDTKHDRSVCSERGENFRQLCPACDVR